MKTPFLHMLLLSLGLASCTDESSLADTEDSRLPDQFCYQRHVIDNSGSGADGVHLGDFNGDGYPDVVSGWEESAELKIYLHPAEQLKTQPAHWKSIDIGAGSNVSAIEDAAFFDMDDDGKLDSVLSATEGENRDSNRRIRLHRLDGDQTMPAANNTLWQSSVIHADRPTDRFMKVRGAQLDDINGADVVALSRDLFENPQDPEEITTHGGVFLFTAPSTEKLSTPNAWKKQRLANVHKGKSVELLDMDADNDLDILYSGARNVVWLENPLHESKADSWESHWIGTASDLALCDLNGDGFQDIVATASAREYPVIARWFEGKGDDAKRRRKWTSHEIRMANELPNRFYQPNNFAVKSIACARLDGTAGIDTPASIVITTSGSGFGLVQLTAPQDYAPDYTRAWLGKALTNYQWIMKYDNILAVDLDADGDMDLITTEENEGMRLRGAGVLWYERKICD